MTRNVSSGTLNSIYLCLLDLGLHWHKLNSQSQCHCESLMHVLVAPFASISKQYNLVLMKAGRYPGMLCDILSSCL